MQGAGRGHALIIVDVQNDFCEGGSLPVDGGAECATRISDHVADHRDSYQAVVATKDWHIDPGSHFGDPPDWVDSWPAHCVAETPGAEFHSGLSKRMNVVERLDAVFRKGEHTAAYSGFEGVSDDGVPLAEWLRRQGISSVRVVGIATRGCVKATALGATQEGFDTTVLADLCADPSEPAGVTEEALAEMRAAGVRVRDSVESST